MHTRTHAHTHIVKKGDIVAGKIDTVHTKKHHVLNTEGCTMTEGSGGGGGGGGGILFTTIHNMVMCKHLQSPVCVCA